MRIFERNASDRRIDIRPMQPEDIETVREVGQIAWSDLAQQDIGRKFRYPKRSEKLVEAYMAMEPGGCLVAEMGQKIIGSAFCHVWGGIGWIGPLEVLPDVQNLGVGKMLLAACERHLVERGCAVIGLETMSHLAKHLHFYLSSGYIPASNVLIMEKVLRFEGTASNAEEVTAATLPSVMNDIARLSGLTAPGLDYSDEARSVVDRRMGHLFIVRRDGEVVGFAILHTYQKGEEGKYSSVKTVLVDHRRDDALLIFDSLLDRCEEASLKAGKDRILVRMSARYPALYRHMTSRSYQLKGANVRMIKKGEYQEQGTYLITSWAG